MLFAVKKLVAIVDLYVEKL